MNKVDYIEERIYINTDAQIIEKNKKYKNFYENMLTIPVKIDKDHWPTPIRSPYKDNNTFFEKLTDGTITDINETDAYGWGYLHYAAANNNSEVIQKLIDLGANINLKNDHDQTPLVIAIDLENLNAVKKLLENKADINTYDFFGYHTLLIAEMTGNKKINEALNLEKRKKTIDIYTKHKKEKIIKKLNEKSR